MGKLVSINPAAIMAEHRSSGEAGECVGDNYDCPYMWPCPTYQLAAEVARVRAVVADSRLLPIRVRDAKEKDFAEFYGLERSQEDQDRETLLQILSVIADA